MRRKKIVVPLAVVAVLAAGLWVRNSSMLAGTEDEPLRLLAHRGVAQTFDLAGVGADTCTATRIHPPTTPHLENTLASLRAAFEAGAATAEIDVQVTSDRQLAVFHDPVLECRTDGRGAVSDHTMAELRRLDVGYGYTADGGATFPLRGSGAGLMPTVPEVFAAFPDRELKIDMKRDDRVDGELVAEFLATVSPEVRERTTISGGDVAVSAVRERFPQMRAVSRGLGKDCLLAYAGVGWTGHVPDSCRRLELPLPAAYGRWLWGWPNLFVERMRSADTRVVLVRSEGDWSAGFDTAEHLAEIPDGWAGGVWTNRADVVAPLLARG